MTDNHDATTSSPHAWRSEAINELAAALARAQGQMQSAKKDADNPFFRSKYADLASVVDAIRAPFSENGLAFTQIPYPTESDSVEIETVLMHASGQWISGRVWVPVAKSDAQGYGSALTYARRYGLQSIAGVAAEDDDGNAAAKAKPEHPRKPATTPAAEYQKAAEKIADQAEAGPEPELDGISPENEGEARAFMLGKIADYRKKKKISEGVFEGICAKYRVQATALDYASTKAVNDILNAVAQWRAPGSDKV